MGSDNIEVVPNFSYLISEVALTAADEQNFRGILHWWRTVRAHEIGMLSRMYSMNEQQGIREAVLLAGFCRKDRHNKSNVSNIKKLKWDEKGRNNLAPHLHILRSQSNPEERIPFFW